MAPLVRANRSLVIRGLDAVARGATAAACRRSWPSRGVEPSRVDTETLSFMLGPRLNAAGRLAHARLSLDLLLCDDADAAWEMARRLDSLNRQRQRQTATALELAWSLLAGEDDGCAAASWSATATCRRASRASSRRGSRRRSTGRPSSTSAARRVSRGSGRSIPEFDVAAALRGCGDLFLRVGGHQQAAGFTADNAHLPAIKERLIACAEERLAGLDLAPTIDVDTEIGLRELGREEIRWLAKLAPYGVGNPEPVLLSRGVTVADYRVVGSDGKHLRLTLKDGYATWPAIAFGLGDVRVSVGQRVDVVYSLSSDRRDGSLQLTVHDLAPST